MNQFLIRLILAGILVGARGGGAVETSSAWPAITLASPGGVTLAGPWGEALERGVGRLAQTPYSTDWLLADVSFQISRIFTNYSGDVSGRFLELAVLTSPRGRLSPATLPVVVESITRYQKPDGHFGVDIDLNQPLRRNAPPIPMLWGNARLLVGLVTAARELSDPRLLAAARRLGDFYVNTADQLCAPEREAEYRASGSGGDGYTCCYFPAMEGLTLLYRATKDERYLRQARRMAEWFRKFDALPIDHSHGNLCAWRGILELYGVTGERAYLDRARAKWDAAVRGGFVWPLGGVGEHWYVSYTGDEGCSESDWLRCNLDLWRWTGTARYLDMAERLLENQYAANQCSNGGYGWRPLESEAAGPVATRGTVDEWNFCCNFHGPLGLHCLKAYLAAGSEGALYVNFPASFTAPVPAGGTEWRVMAKTDSDFAAGQTRMEIEVAPRESAAARPVTVWLRVPAWAGRVEVAGADAAPRAAENGYWALKRECRARAKFVVTFRAALAVEGRRFQPLRPEAGKISRLSDVSLVLGPKLLFALAPGPGRANLLATVDASGGLHLLRDTAGNLASVNLPGLDAAEPQILAALESARPVALQPWSASMRQRAAFVHNLVVVPADFIPAAARARFAERAHAATLLPNGPFYGTHLETQPDRWPGANGWQFTTNGLWVAGGDVGLLEGEGYTDYRFEFDLQLPKDGGGIAGWVVRAAGPGDLVMFQLQSADAPYQAPEFKTRPNTLRPHVRRGGAWTIAEPVPLPKEIRRGETHHVAVECRADRVEVFLDGARICAQSDSGLRTGTVGFRAAGPAEAGLYRNVTLRRLP